MCSGFQECPGHTGSTLPWEVRNPQTSSSQPLTQSHCMGRRGDTRPGPWRGENQVSPASKELEVRDNLSP